MRLPRARDRFLRDAQQRSTGLIFLVEPLFAAATFGLASLDFFTTTGARLNELLQVSLSPDCLYTLEVEGRPRFLIRLVPTAVCQKNEPIHHCLLPSTGT